MKMIVIPIENWDKYSILLEDLLTLTYFRTSKMEGDTKSNLVLESFSLYLNMLDLFCVQMEFHYSNLPVSIEIMIIISLC